MSAESRHWELAVLKEVYQMFADKIEPLLFFGWASVWLSTVENALPQGGHLALPCSCHLQTHSTQPKPETLRGRGGCRCSHSGFGQAGWARTVFLRLAVPTLSSQFRPAPVSLPFFSSPSCSFFFLVEILSQHTALLEGHTELVTQNS